MIGFWKGVCGRWGSRAGSEGGETTGLNLYRLTVGWYLCQRIVTSCTRLNSDHFTRMGRLRDWVQNYPVTTYNILEIQNNNPLCRIKDLFFIPACVISYYNDRWRGICPKFVFWRVFFQRWHHELCNSMFCLAALCVCMCACWLSNESFLHNCNWRPDDCHLSAAVSVPY